MMTGVVSATGEATHKPSMPAAFYQALWAMTDTVESGALYWYRNGQRRRLRDWEDYRVFNLAVDDLRARFKGNAQN